MSMCLCLNEYMPCVDRYPLRQNRASDVVQMELQVAASCPTWVPGTKFQSSEAEHCS